MEVTFGTIKEVTVVTRKLPSRFDLGTSSDNLVPRISTVLIIELIISWELGTVLRYLCHHNFIFYTYQQCSIIHEALISRIIS